MRAIRDNWAFILLLIVALILVFLLIGLQSAILSSQQSSGDAQGRGLWYELRHQIALMIAPATDTPLPAPPTATVAPPTATPLPPPPTSTPIPPPPTSTPLPVLLPTATPLAPTPLPLPTNTLPPLPPTPAVLPTNTVALPTATVVAPVAAPVAANSGQTTTQTSPARADFRLGYIDRQDGCPFVTELVRLVLERNLNFTVETVPYSSIDSLYVTLASTDPAQRLDITVCYTDPVDRTYLESHFGFVILIGSAYRQFDDKSFIVLGNAALKKVIQREHPCMYNFLTNLRIDNADFQNSDAQAWYDSHSELIRSWTSCP